MLSQNPEVEVSDQERGIRLAVLEGLRQGQSPTTLSERLGLSVEEIYAIQKAYYDSIQSPDERTMSLIQMERLDQILTLFWDTINTWGVVDSKGNFAANLNTGLSIIREISDLVGLRKQRITQEVTVIKKEQQAVVVAFVDTAANALLERLRPYLTPAGQRLLEERGPDLITESVNSAAGLMDRKVLIEGE